MANVCEKVEQLNLFLENRPGILADLCAHLADNGINLRAIATLDSSDTGIARLVVDKPDEAKQTLVEAGIAFTTSWCLALEMPNHPGGFSEIARLLSLAGVNISYIYASSTGTAGYALGIFGVSEVDKAMSLDWSSLI
jgi:hypothetical protein